ncbi:MAG: hypothetical protein M1824_000208 [Vezdaea acicularis]|nr:MAG: hypothetical protein M1824_000208 [Vezdaea acicularis]
MDAMERIEPPDIAMNIEKQNLTQWSLLARLLISEEIIGETRRPTSKLVKSIRRPEVIVSTYGPDNAANG